MSEAQTNVVKMPPSVRVRSALDHAIPDLARSLPPGVPAERFRETVVTAILQNPELQQCDRESLWQACRRAANSGLMPDGKESAIVPRKDKAGRRLAHWMPMVQGIIKVAKERGGVKSINAHVIYQGEKHRILLGDDERIEHERDPSKVKRGKEVAVYAVARLVNGDVEREPMTWEQVMQVRRLGAERGPWESWPEEMARKTVIRRLLKRVPALREDPKLAEAIESVDELYDFDGSAETMPDPEHAAAPVEAVVNGEAEEAPDDGWPGPPVGAATAPGGSAA